MTRNDLLEVLETVKPCIVKHDLFSNMNCVFFDKKAAYGFNDVACIIVPFKSELECAVNFDDLKNTLERLNEDAVIEFKDNTLYLKDKITKAKLNTVDLNYSAVYGRITEVRKDNEKDFYPVTEDFLRGVSLCSEIIPKNATGVFGCIEIKGKDILSAASFRISWYEMKKPLLLSNTDISFLLKAIYVPIMEKLKITSFNLSDNWVHFCNETGVRISIKRVRGIFPEVRKYFLDDKFQDEILFPEDITDVIESVIYMLESKDPSKAAITLMLNQNRLYIKAEKSTGDIEKDLEVKYDGKDVVLNINPTYLNEILQNTGRMLLGENKGLFVTEDGKENYKHILSYSLR